MRKCRLGGSDLSYGFGVFICKHGIEFQDTYIIARYHSHNLIRLPTTVHCLHS